MAMDLKKSERNYDYIRLYYITNRLKFLQISHSMFDCDLRGEDRSGRQDSLSNFRTLYQIIRVAVCKQKAVV